VRKLLIGVATLALMTGAANAADLLVKAPPPPPPECPYNDIVRANNQVSVDFVDNSLHYGPEYLTGVGAPLDKETGWVPGFDVTGSLMGNVGPVCNLYVWGRFTYLNGHTQYVGSFIGGAFGSLVQTDGATVNDFDFRLGKGFNVGQNGMITPYFGVGSNWWDRLITGVGGYNEDYKHDYAGVGLLVQYSPAPRWVLSANGLVGRTFDASEQSSTIPGGAALVCVCTFPLGSSTTYMVGGNVDYAITEHFHANAGIDYTYFRYGQSPVVTPGPGNPGFGFSWLEPNSKTSYLLVSIGGGYSW
jgi:opacity protein-like surface antigen